MNQCIKYIFIIFVSFDVNHAMQIDKQNSEPCAPPLYTVLAVSVQEDGHHRSSVGVYGAEIQPAQAVSFPAVQVCQPEATEIDPEYHSYLRDVCQCVAVPCRVITGCYDNECRFLVETFDCQNDYYNNCCYAHVCFDPCDRIMNIFCDGTRDVRPDIYCSLQDPDHCITSCVCIPLTLVAAIATAPITIPIRWCCRD